MTDRIKKGIDILNWAIVNEKTLFEACKQFKVSEKYVRDVNKDCKDQEGYHIFQSAYSKFKNKEKSEEDFIDKSNPIKKQSIKFTKENNLGELDARGDNHVKRLDELVKEAKIDLQIWQIDRHVVNKWDVTNAAGQVYQNWQIKAWLSKKVEVEQAINASNLFQELIEKKKVQHTPVKYVKKQESNLLELNIFDLHLGKLCWSEEVNNNYDTKIASKRFNYALQTLVKRASSCEFERIVFPVGNDFFNADNHLNTTTLGTRVDEDSRWQKTFKVGLKLLVDGIDQLREYAPVDILVIPGNHDYTKSFYLGESLSAWYRNDKNVTVNNSANPRKYYEYGNNLIGYTHGNNEKIEKLRSLMAYEAKEAWARTIYKEWHIGHQHRSLGVKHVVKSDMIQEELGVLVRSMRSLSGTDSWHHQNAYVGPVRAAEAFIWNKETGMIGSYNVNIKLNDDL